MSLADLTTQNWINLAISAGAIALTAVLGRALIGAVARAVSTRITSRTRTDLDDLLLGAIRLPLYWFVVALVTDVMIRRLSFLPEAWDAALEQVFFVLYFIAGFVLAWRLAAGLFEWYAREMTSGAEDPRLATGLVRFFQRVALIVVAVIGLIILLSHFGADITGLVATLGVGSLAFALAAQAAFEDTITGFIIMVDQPFRVGDRIEIMDLDTWGDVVDIGLRSSRINTVENRMVIVPNSVMGKSLIVNHSYPDTQYRLDTTVGVAYGTDLERARGAIVAAVEGVPGVVKGRPIEALFMAFGESSLDFRVFWWIESYEDTLHAQDRVNTAIYNALNAAGIAIPFPQRDVNHHFSAEQAAALARALRGDGGSTPAGGS